MSVPASSDWSNGDHAADAEPSWYELEVDDGYAPPNSQAPQKSASTGSQPQQRQVAHQTHSSQHVHASHSTHRDSYSRTDSRDNRDGRDRGDREYRDRNDSRGDGGYPRNDRRNGGDGNSYRNDRNDRDRADHSGGGGQSFGGREYREPRDREYRDRDGGPREYNNNRSGDRNEHRERGNQRYDGHQRDNQGGYNRGGAGQQSQQAQTQAADDDDDDEPTAAAALSSESEEEDPDCPLCMEKLDATDKQFKPCVCGYQVCLWCWSKIASDMGGKCPACRRTYDASGSMTADPAVLEMIASSAATGGAKPRKARKKQEESQNLPAPRMQRTNSAGAGGGNGAVRVLQRNLLYVVGLPLALAKDDLLRKREYFGKFGKIVKVALNVRGERSGDRDRDRERDRPRQTCSLYVTYKRGVDCQDAIRAVNGCVLLGCLLRATYGTSKYCANWLRGQPCLNASCLYLHDTADAKDCTTKDELSQFIHEAQPNNVYPAAIAKDGLPGATASSSSGHRDREHGGGGLQRSASLGAQSSSASNYDRDRDRDADDDAPSSSWDKPVSSAIAPGTAAAPSSWASLAGATLSRQNSEQSRALAAAQASPALTPQSAEVLNSNEIIYIAPSNMAQSRAGGGGSVSDASGTRSGHGRNNSNGGGSSKQDVRSERRERGARDSRMASGAAAAEADADSEPNVNNPPPSDPISPAAIPTATAVSVSPMITGSSSPVFGAGGGGGQTPGGMIGGLSPLNALVASQPLTPNSAAGEFGSQGPSTAGGSLLQSMSIAPRPSPSASPAPSPPMSVGSRPPPGFSFGPPKIAPPMMQQQQGPPMPMQQGPPPMGQQGPPPMQSQQGPPPGMQPMGPPGMQPLQQQQQQQGPPMSHPSQQQQQQQPPQMVSPPQTSSAAPLPSSMRNLAAPLQALATAFPLLDPKILALLAQATAQQPTHQMGPIKLGSHPMAQQQGTGGEQQQQQQQHPMQQQPQYDSNSFVRGALHAQHQSAQQAIPPSGQSGMQPQHSGPPESSPFFQSLQPVFGSAAGKQTTLHQMPGFRFPQQQQHPQQGPGMGMQPPPQQQQQQHPQQPMQPMQSQQGPPMQGGRPPFQSDPRFGVPQQQQQQQQDGMTPPLGLSGPPSRGSFSALPGGRGLGPNVADDNGVSSDWQLLNTADDVDGESGPLSRYAGGGGAGGPGSSNAAHWSNFTKFVVERDALTSGGGGGGPGGNKMREEQMQQQQQQQQQHMQSMQRQQQQQSQSHLPPHQQVPQPLRPPHQQQHMDRELQSSRLAQWSNSGDLGPPQQQQPQQQQQWNPNQQAPPPMHHPHLQHSGSDPSSYGGGGGSGPLHLNMQQQQQAPQSQQHHSASASNTPTSRYGFALEEEDASGSRLAQHIQRDQQQQQQQQQTSPPRPFRPQSSSHDPLAGWDAGRGMSGLQLGGNLGRVSEPWQTQTQQQPLQQQQPQPLFPQGGGAMASNAAPRSSRAPLAYQRLQQQQQQPQPY